MWPWRVKMQTQNLLRLLLLLMLMLRIMLATVCSAFCRWCFVEVMKLNQVEILKLGLVGLVKILNFKFSGVADVKLIFLVDAYSRDFEDEMWQRFAFELVLWYDFKKLLWQDELKPRVRCAFGNVLFPIFLLFFIGPRSDHSLHLPGTHWLTHGLVEWINLNMQTM